MLGKQSQALPLLYLRVCVHARVRACVRACALPGKGWWCLGRDGVAAAAATPFVLQAAHCAPTLCAWPQAAAEQGGG